MRSFFAGLVSLSAVTIAAPSYAADAYKMDSIVLLQPESMIVERVPGGAPAIAAYIQQVNAAISEELKNFPHPVVMGGAIYIGVRPGNRSQAWLGSPIEIPNELEQSVVRAVRSVHAPEIVVGTFVFAINASFWGGPAPPGPSAALPKGWFEFLEGERGMEITALVDKVWRP